MREFNVTEAIDQNPIGPFQKKVAGLCALIAGLEGFNTQSVGFVAPAIARAFHLQAQDLGIFFSLGLFGLLCGALLIAPLADRFGRRPILLCCIAALGLLSILTAFSSSVEFLDALRFATGLAVGGALPNTIALTAEYAPRRRRALMVAVMFSGFVVGSIVAGLTARWIAGSGWQSVFIIGGVSAILAAPFLLVQLPESVRFLILHGGSRERIADLVRRLNPGAVMDATTAFTTEEAPSAAASLRMLFRDGRTAGTILLWVISFSSLFNIFLMGNWLPTEMRALGFPIGIAILVGAVFQTGGLFGIFFGWLADRIGANVALGVAYLTGAFGVLLIPLAGSNASLVFPAVFVAGFGIIGGQTVTNAVSAMFYPTEMRSTGVGWATGIGRVGSIVGPALAGILLQISIPPNYVILLAVIPALVASGAALSLVKVRRAFSQPGEATA